MIRIFGGASAGDEAPDLYEPFSGESVGEAARFYKVPADHVLVISDDVSLPLGKLRMRKSGSAGGHNGLKNIIQHLGTDAFPVSRWEWARHPDHEMIDWVIGKPQGEEAKTLRAALDRAADAALSVIDEGPDRAMNRFNYRPKSLSVRRGTGTKCRRRGKEGYPVTGLLDKRICSFTAASGGGAAGAAAKLNSAAFPRCALP